MNSIAKWTGALLLATAMTVPGASAFAQSAEDETLDITMIYITEEGYPFFNPVKQGAEDAAAALNARVTFQYGNGNPERFKSLIEGALAAQPDGVAVGIFDDNAFDAPICALREAGIPVIAYNVDDSEGAAGNCRMAFIGQDFVATGYLIGKRIIETAGIGEGDLVFTPVDAPDAVYAILRQRGVDMAMQEVGARTEILGTGFNDTEILNAQVQYLIGHPETKAIIGIGLPQVEAAIRAVETVQGDIAIGGFDLSQNVIDAIKAGKVVASVDQQPYTQGFYSVAQLIHNIRYGLYPSDMKTGGDGLVDATNYQEAEVQLGVRR